MGSDHAVVLAEAMMRGAKRGTENQKARVAFLGIVVKQGCYYGMRHVRVLGSARV